MQAMFPDVHFWDSANDSKTRAVFLRLYRRKALDSASSEGTMPFCYPNKGLSWHSKAQIQFMY